MITFAGRWYFSVFAMLGQFVGIACAAVFCWPSSTLDARISAVLAGYVGLLFILHGRISAASRWAKEQSGEPAQMAEPVEAKVVWTPPER